MRSRLGKGTAFFLTLTFDAAPAPAGLPPAAPQPARPEELLRGRHVLLCEDHPLNQEITCALLEQRGAAVDVAENGRVGAARFAASPLRYYDLVLMDVRMPVEDGYAATREIRALPRPDAADVPILAMTADAFADDVARCRAAGMDGHIAKPIEPELLFAALADVLVSAPPDGA